MSPHLNLNSPLIIIPDYQSSWVLRTNNSRITSTDRVVDSGMWENQLDKDLEYEKKHLGCYLGVPRGHNVIMLLSLLLLA